ncbi:hypothetical protein AMTR_s00044p00156130 [Amborella trichopoda]|uniref:Uncharacterized protein n=1 Tax=Amborella trichopoda TaxID=13333 RepID=U5CV50_AMBTC|nr:hypothetical protein AMTR_s00044p00156130 [Amborella trichopoda]
MARVLLESEQFRFNTCTASAGTTVGATLASARKQRSLARMNLRARVVPVARASQRHVVIRPERVMFHTCHGEPN